MFVTAAEEAVQHTWELAVHFTGRYGVKHASSSSDFWQAGLASCQCRHALKLSRQCQKSCF